ncbi:MAG TPA: NUDIX hydrolase [Deltaproteobacteria bacterium]|jgi:8-oxo-dGTP pyrophosphatase MutT (NUDIX family)|nr:NUDIX hydrolase [Deltaproteobacteria bacterium]
MSEARRAGAKPVPAATVLLVRDRVRQSGLEVFMVERHQETPFAGGATVFPGGKVHPSDASPALRERCRGAQGLADAALTVRVAAIRESFEECGILLARPHPEAAGDELLPAARLADLWKRYRSALERHELSMEELVREEELELACDLLVPFAHWITPEGMPKRFDTYFFIVRAPSDQVAVHDGHELVGAHWLTPAEALADADAGRRSIIFPTRMNLAKLGRSRSAEDAIAAARTHPVVTVLPRLDWGAKGAVLRIPAEAGYDIAEAPLDDVRRS